MTLLTFLTTFWGVFEPFSALALFIISFTNRSKQRTSYRDFGVLAERAFDLTSYHIERFGLELKKIAPREKKEYINEIKRKMNFKNGSYQYVKGEIELFFLSRFILPKENRIDKFLIISYYYIEGYLDYLPFLLRREKFIKYFTNKKTFYHYLSIRNWSTKNYKKLLKEVVSVTKVEPNLNEKYKLDRAENILTNNPSISKTIDIVLNEGKISERTIFNLAASEKIIIVHKYGEGFNSVFAEYQKKLDEVKIELEKAKKSIAKDAQKRVEKYSELHKELTNKWPRVPLNVVLEGKGFQTLFNNLKGVYVYPLSMLPEKYQKNFRLYFEEIIIPDAENYLSELRQNNQIVEQYVTENKYLFIAHIVSIVELEIFTKDRSLEVSSKALSKMLLSTFLSKQGSQISNIYINDLIRNVDFQHLLNSTTKTGDYLIRNLEKLKEILYNRFKIDLYKPITLISLSPGQLEETVERLIEFDSSGQKRLIIKMLNEKINFYKELNEELNKILKKKNVA